LAFYLVEIGLTTQKVGFILTLTLVGDAAFTLLLTSVADRVGRRKMLMVGAFLMFAAGAIFLFTRNYFLITLAAIIGVISPSGNEIGPFLSIEQAGLSELTNRSNRTKMLAWYNLAGSFATAIGALTGGWMVKVVQATGHTSLFAYQSVLAAYAVSGLLLLFCFMMMSHSIEPAVVVKNVKKVLGLHKSKKIIFKLSSLFALDAFAGGFVVQSMIAYWFYLRYGAAPATIGTLFFFANILAGVSALLAVPLSKKIGLINTMVYTHIPSNILLILVPFMPSLPWAIALLLARFSISQMDVPTRQAFTLSVVEPDERAAAQGVTAIARSIGAAISPSIAGVLIGIPSFIMAPFVIAGTLKIVYDFLLFREFKTVK
jgi:MFS family permease